MNRAAVGTTELTKRYGATTALDAVTLSVPTGSVYGLVGPNGAGKTTLLGILAGLRRPTGGSYRVDAATVGVLPDTPSFDPWLTASEVVDLARTLTPSDVPASAVGSVLERTGLDDVANRRVGGFSRGMLQRLGLAAVVVGGPDLLLLDEPAAALDPAGRREVLDMVAALKGDATVVFSSHILDDVQEVCDTIGILRRGSLAYEGSLEELVAGPDRLPAFEIEVRRDAGAVRDLLRSCDWTTEVTVEGSTIRVTARSSAIIERELVRCLARANAPVVSIGPVRRSLEDVFLEVTA